MNAARAVGLPLDSSRPQSRAARREAAARLQVEQEAAAEQEQEAAVPVPAERELPTVAPPIQTGPAITIPMKKRGDKRPFSTQLRGETTTRLTWLVAQGGVLTDVADAAITAYLDAAGVPRPGPDGTMPTTAIPDQRTSRE